MCVCLFLRLVKCSSISVLHMWQVKFRADETDVELRDLVPSTDYSVTVYALYEDEPSDPVTAIATTCKRFGTLYV